MCPIEHVFEHFLFVPVAPTSRVQHNWSSAKVGMMQVARARFVHAGTLQRHAPSGGCAAQATQRHRRRQIAARGRRVPWRGAQRQAPGPRPRSTNARCRRGAKGRPCQRECLPRLVWAQRVRCGQRDRHTVGLLLWRRWLHSGTHFMGRHAAHIAHGHSQTMPA
jgi:hypothetical protein